MPRRVTQSAPAVAAGDDTALDLSKVATIVAANDPQSNLIALLQRAQAEFGYLPEPVVQEIARLGGVPASRIYGVITFYSQFTTEPSGRNKICVCHGTACHVAGASRITEAISQELGVDDGGTTEDMNFTLDSVACMGACSQAPVMRINDETYGHLAPDTARKVIRELLTSLGLEPADLAGAITRGGNDE
ncbi:MAG: NADH-quinone oxidoreductase subunit NuoE [Thermoleophilia bacterium]